MRLVSNAFFEAHQLLKNVKYKIITFFKFYNASITF